VVRAQPLSEAEVKKLLGRIHQMRVKSPHVRADFEEEKVTHFLNKPLASTGKVWFQAPNKFRREMKGSAQTVAVSNGHDFWIYFPNSKSTQHFTLGKNSPVDAAIAAMSTALNLENVENMFQVSGSKVSDGYELQLQPRTPSVKRVFQRFDLRMSRDRFLQRTEMLKQTGDRNVTKYSNETRTAIQAATL